MINKYSLFSKLSLFALRRNKVGEKIVERNAFDFERKKIILKFIIFSLLPCVFYLHGITYCYYVS